MDVARFRNLPLLGILRGVRFEDVDALVDTTVSAGLEAIEITMNTADAPDLIRKTVAAAKDCLMVGAGTVLNLDELQVALDAGATFVVMPTLVREVVEGCARKGIPAFPGALTPQEILSAWRAGATMVKVFPASAFGPGYFREIKGPFNDIDLLACGGVDAENLPAYFRAGASAVAFGASVFRPEWLASGQYDRIGQEVQKLVSACRGAVEGRDIRG